jgi:hypothetical protein
MFKNMGSYKIENDGVYEKFIIEQKKSKHLMSKIFGIFFFSIYILSGRWGNTFSGFISQTIFVFLYAFGPYFLSRFLVKKSRALKYNSFKINKEEIVDIDGQVFKVSDIDRITIRNGVGGSISMSIDSSSINTSTGVGIVDDSTAGANKAMNAGMKVADGISTINREFLRLVAYQLCIDKYGKTHVLAGGMNEATANGILNRVINILKLKQ